MSYRASPRPTFDGPAPIPLAEVTRHVWGDEGSGFVDDWIYVSSDRIHQLVFGLPPGGSFRHSESYRTVFAADEVLTVLSGTMLLMNPERGETHLVRRGESAFFRRDTWHHAVAWGAEELRVLEFFAPPPSTGTSGAYARTRPYVSDPRYHRPDLSHRWPEAMAEARAAETIRVLREADRLWHLDEGDARVLTGIVASTDQLTAGSVRLQPGARSSVRVHAGATGLYAAEGRVNVLIEDGDGGPVWFELNPGDGFHLPEGCRYRLCNMGATPAEVLFGTAPLYGAP